MKTFYCLKAQFFDYGEIKAGITHSKISETKPDNQFEKVYGLTAFKIWSDRKDALEKIEERLLSGEFNIDYIISVYKTMLLLERKNSNHTVFQNWLSRRAA